MKCSALRESVQSILKLVIGLLEFCYLNLKERNTITYKIKRKKETTYLFVRKKPGQLQIFVLEIQLGIIAGQNLLIVTHRRHSQTTSKPDDVEELKIARKKEEKKKKNQSVAMGDAALPNELDETLPTAKKPRVIKFIETIFYIKLTLH